VRSESTILHVDLDAFFAAVEQRDKPSLRGKPVVVGGVGGRGVVATASYEARPFGVHSAMPTSEARRRCPNAAFLTGRFHAYRDTSRAVMALLREISPLVEPLSLDEAFVDLEAAGLPDHSVTSVSALGRELKERVHEVTGGLTGSVGIGSSKLIAKIASDLDKPDGLVVVAPGMEQDLLRPMQVTVIPGVGPATAERLRRVGVHTVEELERLTEDELVRLLGRAHGTGLFALARAEDDRSVEPLRETKSISVEDTYDTDHVDPRLLAALLDRQATKVTERLRKSRLSSGGVRLLGVGVSGLADWIQEDLFADEEQEEEIPDEDTEAAVAAASRHRGWAPGMDVEHEAHGRGWVWGSGRGVVTVRFETAETGPGRVLSFAVTDPALTPFRPPEE
jgi:DNA polymerase-4